MEVKKQPYNTRKRKKDISNAAPEHDAKFEKLPEAEKMSPDLFSDKVTLSQETTSTQRAEREQLEKQIIDFTWVQCDNLVCRKWRRIPVSESEGLSQKQWYCHMGTLSQYNSCDIPEEDHRAYDKLARRLGLSYVLSLLVPGSLVWAKMAGYCRWPAVVTEDPACRMSCEWDQDGEPQVYHVEFLGTKHTHSWIRANKLDLYGHKEEAVKVRCRTKQMALSIVANKTQKKMYQKMPVEVAVREAEELLPLTEEQRLALCTFKYSKPKEEKREEASKKEKEAPSRCCQLCGSDTQRKKRQKPNKSCDADKCLPISPQGDAVVPTSLMVGDQTTDGTVQSQSDVFQFENLQFKSTLLDKSKEEKFKIDVEMYKRNEKAFDHDLRRFMDRNKVPIKKTPVWHQVPIGLFQIFLAVFERGGYMKVGKDRSWAAVYKELTEVSVGHSTVGCAAKKYYERNLYPYELYITGGDYNSVLDKLRKKKHKSLRTGEVDIESSATSNVTGTDPKQDRPEEDTGMLSDLEDAVEDLDAMLSELEAYGNLGQLEDDVEAAQKRLGIDITFHDDSSGSIFSPGVKLADTASEFGLSFLPDEAAQLVPDQPGSFIASDHEDGSQGDRILQELLVLNDEFDLLEHEMADFL